MKLIISYHKLFLYLKEVCVGASKNMPPRNYKSGEKKMTQGWQVFHKVYLRHSLYRMQNLKLNHC